MKKSKHSVLKIWTEVKIALAAILATFVVSVYFTDRYEYIYNIIPHERYIILGITMLILLDTIINATMVNIAEEKQKYK